MDAHLVERWLEAYEAAWASNSPAAIGDLFAMDAVYLTTPFRRPWEGRDAIVAGWLEHRDENGTWEFAGELLATTDDLAFVQGKTVYSMPEPATYHNLWVISLDGDGRCMAFTEWWMLED